MVHRLIGAREAMVSLSFILFLGGCALMPWPFQVLYNTAEISTTINTGKGISEHIVSEVTQTDCNWLRIVYGWKPCINREEYVTNLLHMNCAVYTWNFFDMPYCKE
jgi:hypothetical protein